MKYNEIRRKTKKLKIGNTYIGGDSPIAIQSMTNTDTLHNGRATCSAKKMPMANGITTIAIGIFANSVLILSAISFITIAKIVILAQNLQ